MEQFHWSLDQIDKTDIESLIPFIQYYPVWKKRDGKPRKVYADQVDWL